MAIYRTFAENLRKACGQHESIASVCRGIGINRQQFNKYLSAQALPNSRTLAKISSFLKIDEEALFARDDAFSSSNEGGIQGAAVSRWIRKLPPLQAKPPTNSRSLSDGLYFCYFPLENQPDYLVRSLISVKSRNNAIEFIRRTAFRSPGKRSSLVDDIRHKGFVIDNANLAYLIGHSDDDCSLLAISFDQLTQQKLHFGIALVTGDKGPVACRICLKRIGHGHSRARSSLLRIGVVSVDDETVERAIVSAMTFESHMGSHHMEIFRADSAFVRQLLL